MGESKKIRMTKQSDSNGEVQQNQKLKKQKTRWIKLLEDKSTIKCLSIIDEPFEDNELHLIFNFIDRDCDGLISTNDFKQVIQELLPHTNQHDHDEMFAIIGKNENGDIDFPNFERSISKFFDDYRTFNANQLKKNAL